MDNEHYKFELTPLSYDYSDLEPIIDTETMKFHHDKHFKKYVDTLNNTLIDYPEYHNWSLSELIKKYSSMPESIQGKVKDNAGGVYNHNLLFSIFSKNGSRKPTGELKEKIDVFFQGYENFKLMMKENAMAVFGSGYAWLILNKKGELAIIKTANQDNPLTNDLEPLIPLDVWEHAYYLKHKNNREEYINNFFEILDFDKVEKIYQKALSKI